MNSKNFVTIMAFLTFCTIVKASSIEEYLSESGNQFPSVSKSEARNILNDQRLGSYILSPDPGCSEMLILSYVSFNTLKYNDIVTDGYPLLNTDEEVFRYLKQNASPGDGGWLYQSGTYLLKSEISVHQIKLEIKGEMVSEKGMDSFKSLPDYISTKFYLTDPCWNQETRSGVNEQVRSVVAVTELMRLISQYY